MPAILLGPLLRFVDATRATVWVEVDAPGEVSVDVTLPGGDVRTGSSPTLSLHGHHFALVAVEGLPTGRRLPYAVRIGDTPVWPPTRADWARISERWRSDLDARIRALSRLRDSLTDCIGCGCLSLDRCTLSNPSDELATHGPGPRRLLEN